MASGPDEKTEQYAKNVNGYWKCENMVCRSKRYLYKRKELAKRYVR